MHYRSRRSCPFFGKVKHCGCQRVLGELTSGWTINVDDAGNKSWRWLFEASMVIDLLRLWMVGGELIDIRLVASGLMVPAGRLWCGLWEWLQFRPWNVRFGAAVFPFAGCCAELHGLWADHRLSYPASAVGLAMKSSLLVFCFNVIFWGGACCIGHVESVKG